mmetsp:Transcript_20441/g.64165  ORF Transcript_20441/g.64165 Transcript_20441/m.64165 type:complete len:419 (+) Transcript_20441:279-1535(+)
MRRWRARCWRASRSAHRRRRARLRCAMHCWRCRRRCWRCRRRRRRWRRSTRPIEYNAGVSCGLGRVRRPAPSSCCRGSAGGRATAAAAWRYLRSRKRRVPLPCRGRLRMRIVHRGLLRPGMVLMPRRRPMLMADARPPSRAWLDGGLPTLVAPRVQPRRCSPAQPRLWPLPILRPPRFRSVHRLLPRVQPRQRYAPLPSLRMWRCCHASRPPRLPPRARRAVSARRHAMRRPPAWTFSPVPLLLSQCSRWRRHSGSINLSPGCRRRRVPIRFPRAPPRQPWYGVQLLYLRRPLLVSMPSLNPSRVSRPSQPSDQRFRRNLQFQRLLLCMRRPPMRWKHAPALLPPRRLPLSPRPLPDPLRPPHVRPRLSTRLCRPLAHRASQARSSLVSAGCRGRASTTSRPVLRPGAGRQKVLRLPT